MPNVVKTVDANTVVELVYADEDQKELKQYRVLTKLQVLNGMTEAERQLAAFKDMLFLLENYMS